MILLAFPCDINVATGFCQRVDTAGAPSLVLGKQRRSLERLLSGAGVEKVFAMDEDFYGKISPGGTTRNILAEINDMKVDHAYFPINDFCANTALMLAAVSDKVTAVNGASEEDVRVDLQRMHAPLGNGRDDNGGGSEGLQLEIVKRLRGAAMKLSELYPDGSGREGERPTTGLAQNSPYDCEVLSRYIHASGAAEGRILEIGCGIGYGAFAIAELNPHATVTAIDYDAKAITLADTLWGAGKNLSFEVAEAELLRFEDESFDSVVCFEVIEHVERPDALLNEVRRVLKKGGRLIGSTPNYRLYPYRANIERVPPERSEELRSDCIWPWHIQEFDEGTIKTLLTASGFKVAGFKYPSFVKGISILKTIGSMPFDERVDYLSENMNWSASDFIALDKYHPIFSGYSFIFEAIKA